jgi:hypothetical protein
MVARVVLETFNIGLALSESFYCDPLGYHVVVALVDHRVKIVAKEQNYTEYAKEQCSQGLGMYSVISNYDIQTGRLV